MRKPLRRNRVAVFEINEIDIDKPLEQRKRLGAFIAGRIPNNGDMKCTRCPQFTKHLRNAWRIMACRDQIDVRSPLLILQLEQDLAQPLLRNLNPLAFSKTLVLTVHAPQRTVRKEDCSAPPIAYQTRFFPPVKRCTSNAQRIVRATYPRTHEPIHSAPTRTEHTGMIRLQDLWLFRN